MARNRDYTVPRHTSESKMAQARLKKGWTQGQLAEAIGVKQSQIASWETGARNPKMQALMKIGEVLGVDWQTLIE